MDRKTVLILVKTFFWGGSPKFGRKNHLNVSEDQTKPGQDRLILCKASKTAPPISGRVDRASATKAVDSGLIPGRVTPKTIKLDIHCFRA